MKATRALFLWFTLIALVGCMDDPAVEGDPNSIAVKDFEQALFSIDTAQWEHGFVNLQREFEPFVMDAPSAFWRGQRTDSLLLALHAFPTPQWDALLRDMQATLAAYAFHFQKKPAVLYSYLSRLDLGYPVIFADSLCFVARDCYLGFQAPFYRGMYAYQAELHNPAFAPADVAREVRAPHLKTNPADHSFLQAMVDAGRLAYAMHLLNPTLPEHTLIQYNAEQWRFCEENIVPMWTYFVENKLLFSSDMDLVRRFLQPAPSSKFYLPFDRQTPPRAGQWLGYHIVASYMKGHPEKTLHDLLNHTDAQSLFAQSGFKPRP